MNAVLTNEWTSTQGLETTMLLRVAILAMVLARSGPALPSGCIWAIRRRAQGFAILGALLRDTRKPPRVLVFARTTATGRKCAGTTTDRKCASSMFPCAMHCMMAWYT